MNTPSLPKLIDIRRARAALGALSWMPRPYPGASRATARPVAAPRSYTLGVIRLALLALVLGSVLLWSTPTQAQTTRSTTDAAVSGFSGTLTDLATDCSTLLGLHGHAARHADPELGNHS